MEVRGQFMGHYLSALAFATLNTGMAEMLMGLDLVSALHLIFLRGLPSQEVATYSCEHC